MQHKILDSTRSLGRKPTEMRPITIETGVALNAEGSCLIKVGNTHVLVTATIEETLPHFLRNQGQGWITAEYSLLPRSTHTRVKREASSGKQSARTLEIQRLISRSLRAAVDLKLLGERQILIDCDVINADGGTRTASITGGFVALSIAINHLMEHRRLRINPIISQVGAISCGILNDTSLLDLDYLEDSNAEVDANFILSSNKDLIEVQATSEKKPFSRNQFLEMLELAEGAIESIFALQRNAIESFKG